MLNKKYRFHSRGGVKYTYKHGKTVRSQKLALVFNENPRHFTRIAVVVSKKVNKTAVGRNRIRRRIYEAIRLNFDSLPKNRDYIFIVYDPSLKSLPFSDLSKLVCSLVKESVIE